MSIWAVMAAQHGVASLEQFEAEGVPARTLEHWASPDVGLLTRVQPRVYASAASADTLYRKCWAALLAVPGSALSHRTATYLWGVYEKEPPIEIVVPRGQTPDLRGVIVHQTRDPYVVHRRHGLHVTSPLRAVLDLGAVEPRAVYHAVDKGRVMGLFSIAALEWQMVDVARQGRRGVGALRRVLDDWALGAKRPDGLLEPRFARLQVRYGLPEAVFQHEVKPYRIDFAYPDLMLGIEVDGWEKRANPKALNDDYEREHYLEARGWRIIRFTWRQIVRQPAYVAKIVLEEIGRAERNILRKSRPIP